MGNIENKSKNILSESQSIPDKPKSKDLIQEIKVKDSESNKDLEKEETKEIKLEKNLLKAIKEQDLQQLQRLIYNKSKIRNKSLLIAAMENKSKVVRWLIRSGADINTQDPGTGNTPIFYAVLNDKDKKDGALAMVSELILRGADVNIENKEKLRPLHYARRNTLYEPLLKEYSVARMLIKAGAISVDKDCIDAKFENDKTQLIYAASYAKCDKKYYDYALELIERGADVNSATYKGETALSYARGRKDMLMEHIIIKGASVENKDITPKEFTGQKLTESVIELATSGLNFVPYIGMGLAKASEEAINYMADSINYVNFREDTKKYLKDKDERQIF